MNQCIYKFLQLSITENFPTFIFSYSFMLSQLVQPAFMLLAKNKYFKTVGK